MKNRELVQLLRRAAAGFETPGDLSLGDEAALIEDLYAAADDLEVKESPDPIISLPRC